MSIQLQCMQLTLFHIAQCFICLQSVRSISYVIPYNEYSNSFSYEICYNKYKYNFRAFQKSLWRKAQTVAFYCWSMLYTVEPTGSFYLLESFGISSNLCEQNTFTGVSYNIRISKFSPWLRHWWKSSHACVES